MTRNAGLTVSEDVLVTTGFAFDRFSADNLADPYPLYHRMRQEQPVFLAEAFGVWVVSRYDDVRQVLMDPARFSSAFQIRTPHTPAPGVLDILAEGHPEVPALLNEDPPDHRRTRDLVAKTFSARRIVRLEPRVAAIVTELLDAMESRGQADLVADLSTPLPLQVICELIGLPPADAPGIGAWTRQLELLTLVRGDPGAAAGQGARVGRLRSATWRRRSPTGGPRAATTCSPTSSGSGPMAPRR